MKPSIVWSGPLPPNHEEVEAEIRADLARDVDLTDMSDLIFHHVFLTRGPDYMEGPCVLVVGGARKHEVVCEYHETMEWTEGIGQVSMEAALNMKKQGLDTKEGMKVVTSPAVRKLFKN
jgi:hypothetical protein